MRGRLLILATALLWSTAGVVVKYLSWNAFSIAGFRGLLSMLTLMAFRCANGRKGFASVCPRFSKANVCTGLFMFLTSTSYTLAIKMTTAANAVVLQYIAPMLVMLYAVMFEAHKPDLTSILLTIAVFVGCLLTFAGKLSFRGALGNGIALLSGFALAGQVIVSRKTEGGSLDGLMIGSGLSFVVFFSWLFFEPMETFTISALLAAAFLGIIQYGLANICYAKGMMQTDAVTASLLLTLEPVLAPIWVYLTLGEKPSGFELIGLCCVIAAVSLHTLLTGRKKLRAKEAKGGG